MQRKLPNIRGQYKFDFPLMELSYFKVGGRCDIFYIPYDAEDLSEFLKKKPENLPITCLGNISNTLVLDGGIEGCVVNLINSFDKIEFLEGKVEVGAGTLLPKFIKECARNNISSCEELFCIPGTVGGAIIMNAGVPGFEISDALLSIDCLDINGQEVRLNKKDLNMTYRYGNIPKNLIITSATFKTSDKPRGELEDIIRKIHHKRMETQPITQATCGSTFKNPTGLKAWQLIKEAECCDLSFGGAFVSDMHCNFLVNRGNATAADFKALIAIIKEKVLAKTGVALQEEIIIIGRN